MAGGRLLDRQYQTNCPSQLYVEGQVLSSYRSRRRSKSKETKTWIDSISKQAEAEFITQQLVLALEYIFSFKFICLVS